MTNLQVLKLQSNRQVTAAGIADLKAALPNTQIAR
jgi:hypothetical protein